MTQPSTQFALSIKQPWAALIVYGLKSIEIRRWPTARRGRILIHAARVPDQRAEGWRLVLPEFEEQAQLRGGIIGAVELTGCIPYPDLKTFSADRLLHRNEPEWFEPRLFGFKFEHPEELPFQKYPGWFRFFAIEKLSAPCISSVSAQR